ncbi:MAG: hypothetical protein ABID45_03575 [Patescibacteria group bacterium]
MLVLRIFTPLLIIFEVLNYIRFFKFEVDYTWLGLIVSAFGMWALLEIANYYSLKKLKQKLPIFITILALIMLYLDAFGDMLHFYSTFIWYDQLMHFVGGTVMAIGTYYIFYKFRQVKIFKTGNLGISILTICSTTAIGVIYEWEEYFEDVINTTNRLGDGPDTANDMMLCFFGAVIVSIIISLYLKYKK